MVPLFAVTSARGCWFSRAPITVEILVSRRAMGLSACCRYRFEGGQGRTKSPPGPNLHTGPIWWIFASGFIFFFQKICYVRKYLYRIIAVKNPNKNRTKIPRFEKFFPLANCATDSRNYMGRVVQNFLLTAYKFATGFDLRCEWNIICRKRRGVFECYSVKKVIFYA